MKPLHYLLTLQTTPSEHMHCYLVTKNKEDVQRATGRMIDIVEDAIKDMSPRPFIIPLVLITELTTGAEIVRECVGEQNAEAKELLKKMSNFHISIFVMTKDNPWDAKLMELH